MKNEQGRALPPFSHSPQSKQEVEKANKTVNRARYILEYSRKSTNCTKVKSRVTLGGGGGIKKKKYP
jgi:hypothetical protein